MTLDEATVLIVDDEPILQEVCALWLKQGGCQQVLTASNGLEALVLIEERRVDVLITDVHMPKMDGIVLIRKIRERGFSISGIISMSAYTDVDLAEMSNLGVKKFLEKPFTLEILLEAVATVEVA
jgi:YesN/AraC family two-component response regulator